MKNRDVMALTALAAAAAGLVALARRKEGLSTPAASTPACPACVCPTPKCPVQTCPACVCPTQPGLPRWALPAAGGVLLAAVAAWMWMTRARTVNAALDDVANVVNNTVDAVNNVVDNVVNNAVNTAVNATTQIVNNVVNGPL